MQKVIRLRQLATEKDHPGLLPVGPATIWRWVKSGKFPKPYKLSSGVTVWDAAEVEAFVQRQREAVGV